MAEAQLDSEEHYAFDVFKSFSSMPRDKQQDFRAVVRFAIDVSNLSATRLQTLVLSQGYFPSNVGTLIGVSDTSSYDPWVAMLRAWANGFISMLQDKASSETLRLLGLLNFNQAGTA